MAVPAAAASIDLSARPNEIFPLLIADPRQVTISASSFRLDGRNASDLALGHSWGLRRWRSGENQDWLWEADIEGLADSRWIAQNGTAEFQALDAFVNAPICARKGDVSFKGLFFYENSHRAQSIKYESTQGLRLVSALDPNRHLRAYGGVEILLGESAAAQRWGLQNGLEIRTNDLGWSAHYPASLFLAQDFQWHQSTGWIMNSHTGAGIQFNLPPSRTRALRVQAGYFTGRSTYRQLQWRIERHADFSIAFEY